MQVTEGTHRTTGRIAANNDKPRGRKLALQSFRLQHFKAVQDSGSLSFTPLTVFIGQNGSGKSSLIDGLDVLQTIVTADLDEAMRDWLGFEHLWHHGVTHKVAKAANGKKICSNPMRFELVGNGRLQNKRATSFSAKIELTLSDNALLISDEEVAFTRGWSYRRDSNGAVRAEAPKGNGQKRRPTNDPVFRRRPDAKGILSGLEKLHKDETLIEHLLDQFIWEWQFVRLVPQKMGKATPIKRSGAQILLDEDGANVAEYLLEIKDTDEFAFDGILDDLKYVLPYATDLQPMLTEELEQAVYLRLSEGKFKVPGWLLSQGTLRLLALLALLRHPSPPPLIVIEEIENGLDPRVIHLIIKEILQATESGRTQVIATTHSPYLLDLVPLSSIVLVERSDGPPQFRRPSDSADLLDWAYAFAPGRLYTMGLLGTKTK
jgi:predicted ATPase